MRGQQKGPLAVAIARIYICTAFKKIKDHSDVTALDCFKVAPGAAVQVLRFDTGNGTGAWANCDW
jgi:hypothetical protein